MNKIIEKGSIVYAKLAHGIEMVGRVECQHGNSDRSFFTDIEVISTKKFEPSDIKRYVLLTSNISKIVSPKERVQFT